MPNIVCLRHFFPHSFCSSFNLCQLEVIVSQFQIFDATAGTLQSTFFFFNYYALPLGWKQEDRRRVKSKLMLHVPNRMTPAVFVCSNNSWLQFTIFYSYSDPALLWPSEMLASIEQHGFPRNLSPSTQCLHPEILISSCSFYSLRIIATVSVYYFSSTLFFFFVCVFYCTFFPSFISFLII